MGSFLGTSYGLDEVRRADTVIVLAWSPADRDLPPGLAEALQTAHRRGARILSVCSGRIHFQRAVGTSPLAYRRTFRRADAL